MEAGSAGDESVARLKRRISKLPPELQAHFFG